MTLEQNKIADSKVDQTDAEVISSKAQALFTPVACGDSSKELSEKEELMFGDLQLCSADPVDVSNEIYKQLPGKIAVVADKQQVSLSTDSAEKFLKAIPGIKLNDGVNISGIKQIKLDGTSVSLEGKGKFVADDGTGGKLTINLDGLKAELKLDPMDSSKVTLSNIKGLSVDKSGASIDITQMSLKLIEDKEGNLSLRVTPDNIAGKKRESNDLLSRFKAGYNSVAAAIGEKVIEPFDVPLCNKKDAPVSEVFSELGKWVAKPEARDVNKVAEAIAGLYIDPQFSGLFRGIKGVEKDGNNFVLKSDGGDLHNIGGLPVAWDKEIKAKMEPGVAPKLTIESGMKISLPIPNDVAEACGIKNPQEYAIKEVSLSEPDKSGHRIATVKMDGPVESVSMKVDSRMEPVPIDAKGTVQVDARLKEGNVGLNLQFNPRELREGKRDQINFKLSVTDKHAQLPDALEKFLGNTLDPNLRTILTGIRTFERAGDKISIGREAATSHEIGGLRVSAAKDITFKVKSDDKGVALDSLSGVQITALPGFANTIYRTRLPITLNGIKLSTADADGKRSMKVNASGALQSATIEFDKEMKPQDIWVTVENPVDAFKESLKGGGPAIGMFQNKLKDQNKYTIRIKGNGDVDYGGLSGASDMFTGAGDLVSVEGAAATVIGYVGTKLTQPNNGKAERGVWNSIERSWKSVFGD